MLTRPVERILKEAQRQSSPAARLAPRDVANIMRDLRFSHFQISNGMRKTGYRPIEIGHTLRVMNFDRPQIREALEDTFKPARRINVAPRSEEAQRFNELYKTFAEKLQTPGFGIIGAKPSPEMLAEVTKHSVTPTGLAQGMRRNAYQTNQIAQALFSSSLDASGVISAMKEANMDHRDVSYGFRKMRWKLFQIADALRNSGHSDQQIAEGLRYAGYTHMQIASALVKHSEQEGYFPLHGSGERALALAEAGFEPSLVHEYLMAHKDFWDTRRKNYSYLYVGPAQREKELETLRQDYLVRLQTMSRMLKSNPKVVESRANHGDVLFALRQAYPPGRARQILKRYLQERKQRQAEKEIVWNTGQDLLHST